MIWYAMLYRVGSGVEGREFRRKDREKTKESDEPDWPGDSSVSHHARKAEKKTA